MLIDYIFLSITAVALAAGLAGAIQARRRTPLVASDFTTASHRIMTRLAGLVYRLEGSDSEALEALLQSEDLTLPEWVGGEGETGNEVLRRECRLMLHDILDATSFILGEANQVGRWYSRNPPAGAEVSKSLDRIFQDGLSLNLRVRWARLQLVVPVWPDHGPRSTLEAGRRFVTLCVGFLEMLQHHAQSSAPEARREVSPVRKGWEGVQGIDHKRRRCDT